nr:hypothetical protein [Escherichia coli]
MATLTKKEQAWLNELQDVLDRCPSPKKIGFYTIGDKSIYLYDLRRMDEIMEALDNRSSMDWCVAVHDMNAGFDEKILFPSWICPYISRHLLSLNPLQARCRRYSRGER